VTSAAVLNSETQDLFVANSGEANFQDRHRVVALRSQVRGMLWREVFVQKKLH
jgi:hypothetical protein